MHPPQYTLRHAREFRAHYSSQLVGGVWFPSVCKVFVGFGEHAAEPLGKVFRGRRLFCGWRNAGPCPK